MASGAWPEGGEEVHYMRSCKVCDFEKEEVRKQVQYQVETGDGLLRTHPCNFCGELLFVPSGKTRTSHWNNVREPNGMCCGTRGKWRDRIVQYRPDLFDVIPRKFQDLWRTEAFAANARKVQQLNCFCSMGTQTRSFSQYLPGGLSLSGRTYHEIRGDIENAQNPLRWLLFDPADRYGTCLRLYGPSLDIALVEKAARAVNKYNRISSEFRRIDTSSFEKAHIEFEYDEKINELGAAIGEGDRLPSGRKFTVHRSDGRSSVVAATSPLYEPLYYTLLFPTGTLGWGIGLKKDIKITQMQYYRVLLSQRLYIQANDKHHELNMKKKDIPAKYHFTYGRALLQEYIVDGYSRIQDENLSALRRPYMQQRIVSSNAYAAASESDNPEATARTGRSVLPKSTPGTYWKARLASANAIHLASELGRAHFFITVTISANDPEILRHLLTGQKACDRPDVVNRVFHLKMREFIAKMKNGDFFGGHVLIWYNFVIEWQKRSGLPHMHFAGRFNFARDDMALQYVSAELPVIDENSSCDERRLHYLIAKENMHRNNGEVCTFKGLGESCACREDGKFFCKRGFPKPLSQRSHVGTRGFPNYRRLRKADQFVVPYNREISLWLNCHVNVEVSAFVTHILYMYKYFYKGPDKTALRIVGGPGDEDQITNLQVYRWISAGEANWIMLGFHRYEMSPSVIVLHVHLPGEDQLVVNSETGEVESAMSKVLLYFARPMSLKEMKFQAYFEIFVVPNLKRSVLSEMDRGRCSGSETSVYHVNAYGVQVKRRIRGRVLARIEYIPMSAGDVYFLRLILKSYAAMSFKDARSVAGIEYLSYRETAKTLGLFNEEKESDHLWDHAVTSFLSARSLRGLFVTLANLGGDVERYLEESWSIMAFDLQGDSDEELYQRLLIDLKERMESIGRTLSNFGIQEPDVDLNLEAGLGNKETELLEYNRLKSMLDRDQSAVLDAVQESYDTYCLDLRPKVFLVQACAGSGKTLLARTISHMFRGYGVPVFNSASCGLQAQNLADGKTNHSMYGLPVSDETHITSTFDIASRNVENFVGGVHILDEVQNQHAKNIEAIEALLTDVAVGFMREDERKFAGAATLIMFADMQQIPPVVEGEDEVASASASIKFSPIWDHVTVMRLSINHRQDEDPNYAEALNDIGNGQSDILRSDVPFPMAPGDSAVYCPCESTIDINDIFGHVYPGLLIDGNITDDEAKNCAILSITNASVDEINSKVQKMRPGESSILRSSDYIADAAQGEANHFSSAFLNTLNSPGVPPHEILLKVGDYVFLTRNYSPKDKLMNGSKAVVLALPSGDSHGILIRNLRNDEIHLIPRILFEVKYKSKKRKVTQFKILRRQYPVRLCYAMTVNKAMGQTLSRVAVDLRIPVFSHGQLYVALGRVCRREDALVVVDEESKHKGNGRVILLNKVIRDLLV